MSTNSSSSSSKRPEPSGPICAFGSRLAFTYFKSPAPHPDQLNNNSSNTTTLSPGITSTGTTSGTGEGGGDFWFTIDDQLVYLSFFQDYGPLNIGCL